MADIAIETGDQAVVSALSTIEGIGDILTTERRGIDGATLYTVVITLTPALVTAITAIIRAQIAARKHVRVTRKGMVIQGVARTV